MSLLTPRGLNEIIKKERQGREPVATKCTQCGSDEFCWPDDVETFVCMDCYTCIGDDSPQLTTD